jgi:hypothetical protein
MSDRSWYLPIEMTGVTGGFRKTHSHRVLTVTLHLACAKRLASSRAECFAFPEHKIEISSKLCGGLCQQTNLGSQVKVR